MAKNKLISEAVKKRWAKKTKKQRSEYASKIAKIKSEKMTPAEKSAHGKMMISMRYPSKVSA